MVACSVHRQSLGHGPPILRVQEPIGLWHRVLGLEGAEDEGAGGDDADEGAVGNEDEDGSHSRYAFRRELRDEEVQGDQGVEGDSRAVLLDKLDLIGRLEDCTVSASATNSSQDGLGWKE